MRIAALVGVGVWVWHRKRHPARECDGFTLDSGESDADHVLAEVRSVVDAAASVKPTGDATA